MTDLAADYRALREAVGAAWLRRDVVRASGADAQSYLQGQVTQNIDKMGVGDSALSFVLQPHGKIDSFIRLTRIAADEFLLDVDAGHGGHLIERLERFKLRTKVEFEPLAWKVLALRGPAVRDLGLDSQVVAQVTWPGDVVGVDVFGDDPTVPAGVPVVDPEAYDALRIEAGIPYMGRELDERTIPAEAEINDLAIDFSKGCYTGQELVARIEARGGNVPRHLRGLIVEGDDPPPGGTPILPPGGTTSAKPLGVLTSAAYSPRVGAVVALAYIRRDVLAPAEGIVAWDEGPLPCRIEKLPLV